MKRNKATRIGISDSWSHGWLTQAVVTLNTLPCLLTKQINIHRFIQKQSKKVYSIHSRRTADTRTNRQNQVNSIFVCFFFVGLHKISDNNSIWQLIHSNHTILNNTICRYLMYCSVLFFAYYGDFQWKFSIFISFSDQMEIFFFAVNVVIPIELCSIYTSIVILYPWIISTFLELFIYLLYQRCKIALIINSSVMGK